MVSTAIVKDKRYLRHYTGEYHPENHHRLEAIYEMLEEEGMKGQFREIEPRLATREELEMVHTSRYVDQIAATYGRDYTMLDPDTSTSSESWEVARLAVGGLLNLVDGVVQGDFKNGFALVRPPGHHAETNRGMGFCIFNNVAIAAKYARQKYNLEKILIVDWDLHHGNGTQNAFYEDHHVLYFSTHQFPYYPGSGSIGEIGRGKGTGFTVNVPLPGGQGDAEYVQIFRELLCPIAEEYVPQLVLVSAGFDIYFQDPLGAMNVTPGGFYLLTAIMIEIAQKCCQDRVLMVLEGGYNLTGLRESVKASLKRLGGMEYKGLPGSEKRKEMTGTKEIINPVKTVQKKFWKLL
jgi:acetoin utilization deacetylase AcuC-like enzyme